MIQYFQILENNNLRQGVKLQVHFIYLNFDQNGKCIDFIMIDYIRMFYFLIFI